MSRGDSLSSTPSASYSPNPSFHGSGVNATSSPSHSPPIFASNAKRSPSIVGSDLVDWLLLSSAQTPVRIHSRSQATSMWQVLFEDRVLVKAEEVEDDHRRVSTTSCCHSQYSSSGGLDEGLMSRTSTTSCLGCSCQSCRPRVFEDKYTMYTFWFDCEGREAHYPVTGHDRRVAEREFAHSLAVLCQMAPDAHLRTILRKPPHERMEDDISLIFDELIQIPALSELTASVKQELAHVISYEFHPKKGTVGKNTCEFCPPLVLHLHFLFFLDLCCSLGKSIFCRVLSIFYLLSFSSSPSLVSSSLSFGNLFSSFST